MRMTYDPRADAVYLYLTDRPVEVVETTRQLTANFDRDAERRIVGVEILDASAHFDPALLAAMEQLT